MNLFKTLHFLVPAFCAGAALAQTIQPSEAPGIAAVGVGNPTPYRVPTRQAAAPHAVAFSPGAPAIGLPPNEIEEADVPNTLSEEETAQGWRLLFDGTKLLGLRGLLYADPLSKGWLAQDGALVLPKTIRQTGKVTGGDLVSVDAYENFDLRFDFQLSIAANSGVMYLARRGADQKPVGAEFQIIDDSAHFESLRNGSAYRSGGLTGFLAPSTLRLRKPIAISDPIPWNRARIVVVGNHVEHWLNGVPVLKYDLGTRQLADALRSAKAKPTPGFGLKIKSPILILDQGDELSFRNIKIRPLPTGFGGVVQTARK